MATPIGFIKAIFGEVTATSADGGVRTLHAGDRIFANELITTGPGGAVEIEFNDGSVMDLGRDSQAVLDSGVFTPGTGSQNQPAEQAVADDIAAIQQALLEGQDPTQVAEATAAGAGVEGGNEGHDAVFVDYLKPAVIPDAGFDTIGVINSYDLPEEDIIVLPEEDEPVVPPVPPAVVVPPTASVTVEEQGNVIEEDGSIYVTVTAQTGDPSDELTGVTITLPPGWKAMIGSEVYENSFTLPASGQSFSTLMLVMPGPQDTDIDGVIRAVSHARDISEPSVTASSAEASETIIIDTVLDEAVSVSAGEPNEGNQSEVAEVYSLNLTASTLSPYGQTDGAPADGTESGIATVTVVLPEGAVLGTLVDDTFTALASNTFSGTAGDVANWINSLAIQVPAGFDGTITGSVSVTFTDAPGDSGNPNTANDSYTSEAGFTVQIADSKPSDPVNTEITLEEESIPDFNGNDEDDGYSHSFTGDFNDNATWGLDGFGGIVSVSFNGIEPPVTPDELNMITVTDPDGHWSLVVNAVTGLYTFTLLKPMNSTPFGDNAEGINALPLFNVIGADGDGSTIGFTLKVNVVDDIPTSLNPTTSHLKDMATSPDVVQLLNFAVGADGVGSVKFADSSLQGTPAMDALGNPLTFNGTGAPLFINFSADMTQLQFVTKNPDGSLNTSDVKFFIELNQDGLTYTVHSEGVISNGTAVTATDLGSVGGGNIELKAISNIDGTTQDVVMTTQAGKTVNTNNKEIGVGTQNAITVGEAIRFDFTNGEVSGSGGNLVYTYGGSHNTTTSFRQVISSTTAGTSTANITLSAILADNDTVFFGDSVGEGLVPITAVRVYSGYTLAQIESGAAVPLDNASAGINVNFNVDGTVSITGLKQGWIYEIITTEEFSAVQVGVDAGNIKLGIFSYGQTSDGLPLELDYNIIGRDADGDAVLGSLDVNLYPAGSTFEGDEGPNTLTGTNNADYLLGRGGDDILSGMGGDDLLIGGYGDDQLTGGSGADTFVFSLAANSGNDIITDFTPGTDKLSFIDVIDTDGSTVIDLGDVISSVADIGANVTLNLHNGGSINLQGIGNGTIDTVAELQALMGPANITVEQS